jgi:ABC-type thiamine transport system substrate-binding protein
MVEGGGLMVGAPGAASVRFAASMCARLVVFLLAFLLLAGCDDRETLVIYSPHGKDLLEAYAAAFEEAHPGVVVQWLDMGSQQAFDRVRTEAANPQASLWWGAPQTMFAAAAEQGLLEPYRPTWANAVPPDARDPQDRWYGTYRTPEVIMYNTRRVAPDEVPRTWDDVLHPRFRDRVVIREPVHSGTMRTIFGAMIMRAQNEDQGFRWLARLDMNTRVYAADPTQLYLMMARGEADINALYQEAYAGEPWVEVVEGPPGMQEVRETNFCRISVHGDDRTGRIIVFATIDNLWKGTSSQAVQNLNLMFGRDESEGLL